MNRIGEIHFGLVLGERIFLTATHPLNGHPTTELLRAYNTATGISENVAVVMEAKHVQQ